MIHLAYIDAGSGSLIVQALIAAVIAVPIMLRSQIRRAASAVRRLTGSRTEHEQG